MHHCTITVVDVTGINDDWLADPDSVPQQVKPAEHSPTSKLTTDVLLFLWSLPLGTKTMQCLNCIFLPMHVVVVVSLFNFYLLLLQA